MINATRPPSRRDRRIDLVPGAADLPFEKAAQRGEILIQLLAIAAQRRRPPKAFAGRQVVQILAAARAAVEGTKARALDDCFCHVVTHGPSPLVS
jgi:hypothetical protein